MKNELRSRFYKEKPGQREKTIIGADELRDIVLTQLGDKLSEDFNLSTSLRISDTRYYCTPIEDVIEIVDLSYVYKREYTQDTFDCDDFALVLKAHFAEAAYKAGERRPPHCFGILWGMVSSPVFTHAINWLVSDDKKIYFVEPQRNDPPYEPKEEDKNIFFMLI